MARMNGNTYVKLGSDAFSDDDGGAGVGGYLVRNGHAITFKTAAASATFERHKHVVDRWQQQVRSAILSDCYLRLNVWT